MHANTHDFEAKKTQGKNRAMQRHGQVLPPCRCIAGIASGEYENMPPILARGGGGGNRMALVAAQRKILRALPPAQKIFVPLRL